MSLRTWLQRKSSKSKVITVLVVLEFLQIGLCFSGPQVFHLNFDRGIGWMYWLAISSFVTAISIALIGLFWTPAGEEDGN